MRIRCPSKDLASAAKHLVFHRNTIFCQPGRLKPQTLPDSFSNFAAAGQRSPTLHDGYAAGMHTVVSIGNFGFGGNCCGGSFAKYGFRMKLRWRHYAHGVPASRGAAPDCRRPRLRIL